MKKLVRNGRYLSWEDGTPFFYLGDTAWEIFHKLNREELEKYLSCRARQGFTVIQGVLLAEMEGVTVPNAYGRLPLEFREGLPAPEIPDVAGEYSYWDHVDFALELAAEHGLFFALLPTWGDKFNRLWGKGPEIFTEENAYHYGKWLGERYKNQWNIIWMLGGDRPLEEKHRRIVDQMAKGIREADSDHRITFHPVGSTNSTQFVGDAPYIDFHTAQTGHGVDQTYASDEVMRQMAAACENPFLDSEPRYEDHPACFREKIGYYWNAEDVRQNLYWDLFAGASGHTYGNHCVWSMNRERSGYFPYTWDEVLEHPGAEQVRFAKELRLRRDYFSLEYAPELLEGNFSGMGHMVAAKGKGYAYVYSPLGIPFTVNLDGFAGAYAVRALWFDPRTGEETIFGILPANGSATLAPPTQGKGQDWVLILEEFLDI